jgi:Na+/H+ antiporter NhaC
MGALSLTVLVAAAVLDGAIFGDHCSPISDTTVLSSIASSCDHVAHVKTQMVYAAVTMVVAALCGYLGTTLLYPPPAAWGLGAAALTVVLLTWGRNPEQITLDSPPAATDGDGHQSDAVRSSNS